MIDKFLPKLDWMMRKEGKSPAVRRAVITHIARSVLAVDVLVGGEEPRSKMQIPVRRSETKIPIIAPTLTPAIPLFFRQR